MNVSVNRRKERVINNFLLLEEDAIVFSPQHQSPSGTSHPILDTRFSVRSPTFVRFKGAPSGFWNGMDWTVLGNNGIHKNKIKSRRILFLSSNYKFNLLCFFIYIFLRGKGKIDLYFLNIFFLGGRGVKKKQELLTKKEKCNFICTQ